MLRRGLVCCAGPTDVACILPPSPDVVFVHDGDAVEPPEVSPAEAAALHQLASNAQLAHEVAIDPDFVLTAAPTQGTLEAEVRRAAERAFYEQLAERLDRPRDPDFTPLPGLLAEVRESLCSLTLPRHKRLRASLAEVGARLQPPRVVDHW